MKTDTNSAVYIQTISNQCIISFERMPFWDSWRTNRLSFQVILHGDGRILYQYQNVSSDETLSTVGMQWGAGSVEFYAGNVTNSTALIISNGTDVDSDLDGVSDAWEKKWFSGLSVVTNGFDFVAGSNFFTYAEAAYLGLNPNVTDTDGDGLSDKYEVEHSLNPIVPQDSDNDGMPDRFETAYGLNPANPADALLDPDGDGFPNIYECKHGTDPFEGTSVPLPDRYVSIAGQHITPFTNRVTAAANLQAVLVAAEPYDIILIADGTYTGGENRNLSISGKPLMLLAENGPDNCILDCENEGRALYVVNSTGSVVRGIQFLRGFAGWGYSSDAGSGGAVYCEGAGILFENCRFRSNTAEYWGGVICGLNSSVTFRSCVFQDNGEYCSGGAGYFEEKSSIEMLDCTVTGTLGNEGFFCFESDFLIQNSLFSNNFCCVVEGESSSVQIRNSIFSDNYAQSQSGGVYFYDADVTLSNCVFRNNSVEPGGWGAGALCQEGTVLRAQDCLFSGNSAEDGAVYVQSGSAWLQSCTLFSNQGSAIYRYDSGDIVVKNTIMWGNGSGSYNSTEGLDIEFSCLPEMTGTNNIHVDPKLIAETGALRPNSPCIDRGSDLTASVADISGTPRWDHPWRSNGVDASIADIGAFEFTDSDTDADGVGDLWEIYYFTNITFSSGGDDDADGLSTFAEYRLNTNPTSGDTDGDGLIDGDEVNSQGTDPLNSDSDQDGLSDADEINLYGTDPLAADSDDDGLPDGWEADHGLNPLLGSDALADSDSDGLTNLEEFTLKTDFQSNDSDSDGMPDGWEAHNSLNPLVDDSFVDSDSDGLTNLEEYTLQTDPQDNDSDDDGMPNAWEKAYGLDFMTDDADEDADGDGLTNLKEYRAQTDPRLRDTDADLLSDGAEINTHHTNPLVRDTDGDGMSDWFEVDQGRNPSVSDSNISTSSGNTFFAMDASLSSDGVVGAADADDDGQLDVDELHRYPRFAVMADVHYEDPPPEFLFDGAVVKEDTRWVSMVSGGFGTLYTYAKVFYGEPGERYLIDEILDVASSATNPAFWRSVYISSHFSWSGGTPAIPLTTNNMGTYIYPYSCDYRIESAAAGAFGRKMKISINDNDDNGDGIADCENEVIDGSADTNDMGLVVFKQMVIHPSAPSPHIYLSASSEVRLFRASTGAAISVHRYGEPWSDNAEDIADELRSGDFAVLVEGILPSSASSQTADNTADNWPYIPPYYGVGDPTSQGSWGTYVGLYCKDDVDRYSYFENDMVRFSVDVKPNIKLISDRNRDRQINGTDKSTNAVPFRFWINDDNDNGDIAEDDSDVPGQGGGSWWRRSKANYEDSKVNGRSDLTDFFPVWLDINSALTGYPVGTGVEYRLRQSQSALKFVYTDLTRDQAGDYLIAEVSSCGPGFNQNVYEADTVKLTAEGVTLDAGFLSRIAANPDKGVLLMEAISKSTAPLILQVLSNNTVVAQTELPLSLFGVEDMFRHKNLRPKPSVDDRPDAPNEIKSNGKNFVFVHGYNVSESAAQGWHAEMFKRLYWSGSNARFYGITWYGNQSQFPLVAITPNYQVNIPNAWVAAANLNTYLSSISGEKIVAAHSLGNMLVAAAIQDYSAPVSKFFMIDAAVAMEAYDNTSSDIDAMRHPDWVDYSNRLWATEWHQLFEPGDGRRTLTWRGRFANVVSKAYNFYSSGEEVLERHTGKPYELSTAWNKGEFAWCLQEKLKGRFEFLSWGGSTYGGWDFNKSHYLWPSHYKFGAHTNIPNEELLSQPFFDDGGFGEPLYHNSGSSYAFEYQPKLLAQMIPALSLPVGANEVTKFGSTRNFNMDTVGDDGFKNGWGRYDPKYKDQWLHSDIRDMSYFYVYKVFDKFAGEGGLK